MAKPEKKKDLHLSKSKSLKELNEQATSKITSTTNPKLLVKTADKLYENAQKALLDGDEEVAYVMFARYLDCITVIHRSDDYKKHKEYFNKMIGPQKPELSMKKAEELSDSLKKRYELVKQAEQIDFDLKSVEMKDALENEKKRQGSSTPKTSVPVVNGIVKPPKFEANNDQEKNSQNSGVVTVNQLKSLMEQKSTRFLVIDCRGKNDYLKAHLVHSNCINIPSELLSPGMTANTIEKELRKVLPESYFGWQKRGEFDRVILYDWNSSFENQMQSIGVLYTAMKCDSKTTYKNPPAILQGGMRNLYYIYPTLINFPQTLREDSTIDSVTSSLENLDSSVDDDNCPSTSTGDQPKILISNNVLHNFSSHLSASNPTILLKNSNFMPKFKTANQPDIFERSVKPTFLANNTVSNGPVDSHNGQKYPDQVQELPKGLVNVNVAAIVNQIEGSDRTALSKALDDIIRSSQEVSEEEKHLNELQDKALSSSENEALVTQLKEKEREVDELKKLVSKKEENMTQLQKNYEILVEKEKSKSSLPTIRPNKVDSEIEEKLKKKKSLDEYVSKLREERKKREREESSRGPTVNVPVSNKAIFNLKLEKINADDDKKRKFQNSGVLTVNELKTLIEKESTTTFLVIDCRPKNDFMKAHLVHSNCINIPSELLSPGMTTNKIEKELKKIQTESYFHWQKRGDFDRIILYDWDSSFGDHTESIDVLYTAIKYDQKTMYKNPPAILQGGMKNLYYTYPSLINHPQTGLKINIFE